MQNDMASGINDDKTRLQSTFSEHWIFIHLAKSPPSVTTTFWWWGPCSLAWCFDRGWTGSCIDYLQVVAPPYLAGDSSSKLTPSSSNSRPSLLKRASSHVWLPHWLVFRAYGWSGGALPRWRSPLTHTHLFGGLGSQLCAELVRSGSFVLGFWLALFV